MAAEADDDLEALLAEAHRRGIRTWAFNKKLHIDASADASNDGLLSSLIREEPRLISVLSGPTFTAHEGGKEVPFLEHYHDFWRVLKVRALVTFTNATHWVAKVRGISDATTVVEAFRLLTTKHRILRAVVRERSGIPYFSIHENVQILSYDFGSESAANSLELRRLVESIVWRPFQYSREALFRPFFVQLAGDQMVIGFVLNHIVGDEVSVRTLVQELCEWIDRQPSTPQLRSGQKLQYADYVYGINAWIKTPAIPFRLRYWRQQFGGASVHEGRESAERSKLEVRNKATLAKDFTIEGKQFAGVHELARSLRTTPFFVILAANAIALSKCTFKADIAILCMHHGRDDPRIAGVIGSMQNHLPIRVCIHSGQSFAELVRQCETVFRRAQDNYLPYHYIRGAMSHLGIEGSLPELYFSIDSPIVRREPSVELPIATRSSISLFRFPISRPRQMVPAGTRKMALWSDGSNVRGRVEFAVHTGAQTLMAEYVQQFLEEIEKHFSKS